MTRNCNGIRTGNIPLFPGIMAPMPADHEAKGVELGKQVVKVNGKLVVGFSGMSNLNQEIRAFTRLMREEAIRGIIWFNAGRGNWPLDEMVRQADAYWLWVKQLRERRNITPEQVQVWFVKNSVRHGTTVPGYKWLLEQHIERTVRELPHLKQIFITSAVYSGYAGPGSPRTEPGAYLEGVAVNEYIQEHYNTSPWTAWGSYLWADGMTPRGDGLIWQCSDFELKDGVHPDVQAEKKVAEMLYRFMKNSPACSWFAG